MSAAILRSIASKSARKWKKKWEGAGAPMYNKSYEGDADLTSNFNDVERSQGLAWNISWATFLTRLWKQIRMRRQLYEVIATKRGNNHYWHFSHAKSMYLGRL